MKLLTLEDYISRLTEKDVTQTTPESLSHYMKEFCNTYGNAFTFPLLNRDDSKKKLLIRTIVHVLCNQKSFVAHLVVPNIMALRLMLREIDNATTCLIANKDVYSQTLRLYQMINNEDKSNDYLSPDESRFEFLKLFINLVHVDEKLRTNLVEDLPTILNVFKDLRHTTDVNMRDQIYFLINRLVFYALFDKGNCFKTWQEHSNLICSFWGIEYAQNENLVLSSRNVIEILKNMYNLSIHHEDKSEVIKQIFSSETLLLLRKILHHHVEWRNYQKIKVTLQADGESDSIAINCEELEEEQVDPFYIDTADLTLIKHCCQVLMLVPNEMIGKILCVPHDKDENADQMTLDLDLYLVYGLLRVFFTYIDLEKEYALLHTPLLSFLVKACNALPNLRKELYKGITAQDWTIRSLETDLTEALPEERRKYKTKHSNLDGKPGSLIKQNLVSLMTNYHYNFKSAVCQLLFTICEEDIHEYAAQFGVGNTIGYLTERGFLGGLLGKGKGFS